MPTDGGSAVQCLGKALGAVLHIFPLGESSILKGVTIACPVSCHCRERKAPLTDLRTP